MSQRHLKRQRNCAVTTIKFTDKQGQYLAFIYAYTKANGRPPAVADIQRFFGVTPPTAQNMIVRLTKLGLCSRVPRAARTLEVLVPPNLLPVLR